LITPEIATQLQLLGYVALAMALGALIGLEREVADKPAGFRTHMLVCGASTMLVGIGELLVLSFDGSDSILSVDPVRVIEAIIAGVSFLGAGTIFRRPDQDRVEGLTTAASLLFVAAIGVSVANRQLVLAIGATVIVLLVLRSGRWLESIRQHSKNDD